MKLFTCLCLLAVIGTARPGFAQATIHGDLSKDWAAQKTLLVADLFSFTGQVTAANANAVAFAQKLKDLKLDVKTIIPVHGQSTGIETLWKSVEMAGKN